MKIKVYDFNRNGRTHKSLGINEVVDDAVKNEVNTISMISSGNFIRTLISEIRQRGLENRMQVVNLSNSNRGIDCLEVEIEQGRILRDSNEREKYVKAKLPNCGNVRDYTDFTPRAYELKAGEILKSEPNYVSLGVGSGKLFLALRKVIQERGLKTKLIGILPRGENGVFNNDNLYEQDGNLYFRKFDPKSLADKLVCPYTFYKTQLLQARQEGHILIEVDNKDFKRANKKARKQGLEAEISGSAGFVVLDKKIREQYQIPKDSNVVIVDTGRGYEWENQLKKEGRKKSLIRWLYAGTVSAVIGVAGWMYHNTPSAEEMKYADLNGDGVVSVQEIIDCNLIAGVYLNKEQKQIEKLKKCPTISRETLARVKDLKQKLIVEVSGRFHNNYEAMKRLFHNEVEFDYISDLSFNQLQYLNERARFDDFSAPEFYIWRLSRHMQLNEQGIKIPVWDVR